MIPSVVLLDHSNTITDAELARVAAALQRQVDEHFAQPPPLGWGVFATVRAGTAELPPRGTEWVIAGFTDPDQPGALGYHDMALNGQPLGKFFPLLDKADGVSWSSTASHELLELLADPMLALCFQGPDQKIYAGEVCDAVEQTSYLIDGVEVSNFVLPPYFQASKAGGLRYDYLGKVGAPLEILPGGYNQTWDSTTGWTSLQHGEMRAARTLALAARSRTARRRYPMR